ncbi:ParB-like chromosome segregation protein Spo0J [Streptomyces albogriseolus]
MSQATYLFTQDVPLLNLRPFPGNARRGDPAVILQSLVRTGQFRSLIVRDTGDGLVVLAGNHTLQALLAHGPGPCGMTTTVDGQELPCALCAGEEWKPVARCEIVRCDDATATRINLVDNRSAELGGWDQEALADLIAGLDGDLDGTGYSDADLDNLLRAVEEAYDEEDEEEQPEQPAPAGNTTPAEPATSSAAPASGDTIPEGPPPGTVAPPLPDGTRSMLLTYPAADRDEAARLVVAAREVFPAEDAAVIVLRALRTLVAVLDSRHAHDGVVTVQALLRAAGAPEA